MEINALLKNIANAIANAKDNNIGLFTGMSGFALYELSYGIYFKNEYFLLKGMQFVDKILHKINDSNAIESLCSGIAGVGWLLNYVKKEKWNIFYNIDSVLEEIDKYLILKLNKYLSINYWDYLHGYVGIGIYLLGRVHNNPIVTNALKKIIETLENSAIIDQDTVKWKSMNNGNFNISLSHGISGILIFLIQSYKLGILKERSNILLEGCIAYLLSQRIDFHKYNSFFPTFSLECKKDCYGSRYGWCYGDLGVCYALWYAGNTLNKQDLQETILNILIFESEKRKNLEQNGIKDACFCHGAVGVAHIYYRMWLNTNILQFKNAANYWYEKTINMSIFQDGVVGYKAYCNAEKGYIKQYDFLNGITGIGLSLMHYYLQKKPNFDSCLMLS